MAKQAHETQITICIAKCVLGIQCCRHDYKIIVIVNLKADLIDA